MRLHLAGVAGVGKTTVARIVAERLGLRYHPVEAVECWRLYDLPRQACFLGSFAARLFSVNDRLVADNSLLSVLAYTGVFADRMLEKYAAQRDVSSVAATYMSMIIDHTLDLFRREASIADIVALRAEPETLEERIARRLLEESRRLENINVEGNIEMHVKAQEILVYNARKHGIPIVDAADKSPEEVAEEVIGALRR